MLDALDDRVTQDAPGRLGAALLRRVQGNCLPPSWAKLMLVYGDAERREACRDMLQRIRNLLQRAAAAEGIVGHGLFVAALIEAGALAQGIADQAFAVAGQIDAPSPEAD